MRTALLMSLLLLPVAGIAQAIDPQRLSEITRTLASDEFEGRAPGTAGEKKTIAYLIEQFKRAGAEPGGRGGSWTQPVQLVRTQLDTSAPLTVRQNGETRTLRQGQDVYVSTVRNTDRVRINDAPLVFVGYGVNAPERKWNDFKGVDLKGKVAVVLVNDPDFHANAN